MTQDERWNIRYKVGHGDRYLFHGWLLILGETGTCPLYVRCGAWQVRGDSVRFRFLVPITWA